MTSVAPTSPTTPTFTLHPSLRRLVFRLRFRTTIGLLAQSAALGTGVGVLAWGIAAGLLRSAAAPLLATVPAALTAVWWFLRHRTAAAPLTVLAQAEQQLRLHELWTTAWTLTPLTPAAGAPDGAPAITAHTSPVPPATPATPAAHELATQIHLRAEAAAQSAAPAQLLPLRLPAHWGLALILAGIGLAIGLRPQSDDAEWLNATTANSALASASDTPGGGPAAAHNQTPKPPQTPDPNQPAVLRQLTPAEAAAHKTDLENALQHIDTPEKLRAAQEQFAQLQKQTTLPADQIKAFDELLRAREKALAQNGNGTHTAPTPTPDPTTNPATTPGDLAFNAVSLLNKDRTINPAVLREAQTAYPEYTGPLTRYVDWLAHQEHPAP